MNRTGIRLKAPAPGWTVDADVVVVGSGVAGLTAALRCTAAGLRTVVVTKARLDDGSTRWAQGGIAAALGDGDTPEQHLDDTLVAGAGLCDEEAVRALVTEGPDAVRRLIDTGALFDTDPESGVIQLTREGGHHRRRIAHAGGDATGAEISRALVEAVRSASVRTIENALVLDLLTDADGRTAGVTLHVMGEGQHDGVGAVLAPAVVLATGGMGQVFSATTNPSVSTGDGVALALRAGAEVSDLEFVQFHPTVLFLGADAEGQQPLVSEAVRGEGAHLVDADGVRFMLGQHELAELAPRDIVAKGIMRRMREQGAEHMYLDARHFGAEMWESRFPTILAACRSHGIDPVTDPIPVAPAAHYASGGVRTDLHGRTTVPGLYACGEVACTGVHGANRLASNSLLEGLVFAERIAEDVAAHPASPGPAVRGEEAPGPLLDPATRIEIQRIMTAGAGVLRSAESLDHAATALEALYRSAAAEADHRDGGGTGDAGDAKDAEPGVDAWEATNLLLVSRVLVAAARAREETRGCHWREDRPDRDDDTWRRHLVVRLTPDRTLAVHRTATASFPPVGPGPVPAQREQ
ncbi:L-aspartate oxidase [Streptomyces albidochromogenes]|uniref:L-aspartate oxidase n=1 Tax=Streptomyces albidochromogenes TaxID=329524 RepID=UPI00110FB98C|nr:L-aspartate oxidase [Streptomyces albidochromogenes]